MSGNIYLDKTTLHFSKKTDLWACLILILSSIVFLLIQSTSTSPIYAGYGGDSSVFTMFGRMFNSGKIPYTDFFDHKGPMVIFIQAFAQKIYTQDSRLSTFILQIINISLIQILIYKTVRLLSTPVNSISICLFILIFLRYTFEGGNLTEEYSLLFIAVTFFFTVRILLYGLDSLTKTQPFIIGICSAMLFWIRLNNTGVVFACILFILILFIKEKRWKELFINIILFLVGFLIITVPLVIYFIRNDAFVDMINAAFIHNFKYVESSHPEDNLISSARILLHIFKSWLPFVILAIGTIIYYIKTKSRRVLVFSALLLFFGYITTHIGNAYYHYMVLCIPCLALGLSYMMNGNISKAISRCLLLFISLALVTILCFSAYKYKPFNYNDSFIKDSQEIASKIPLDERDSVYPYHIVNAFLPSAGLQPCYRYFMMQEWTGIANKHIIVEINDMMEHNPPKWIVTQFRSQSTNAKFWEIVNNKYTLYFSNNNFELFRLNR